MMLMKTDNLMAKQKFISAMDSCLQSVNIKTERKLEKESGIGVMEN